MASIPYAELHCHSNFSFLDGASAPDALVERAVELGLTGLAVIGLSAAVCRFSSEMRIRALAPAQAAHHSSRNVPAIAVRPSVVQTKKS